MCMRKLRFIVGIDEAGRGPLAGPVSVGVFIFLSKKAHAVFRGVKDSKKLTSRKRDQWFKILIEEKKKGTVNFSVNFSSHLIIDKKGLTFAIHDALFRGLKKLKISSRKHSIFLDGGLKAPSKYKFQKTIIKGDEKIPAISLASIVAKVLRDRKMISYAKKYPQYGFEIHKGYGTRRHIKMIHKYKPTQIHRKSFLKGFDK